MKFYEVSSYTSFIVEEKRRTLFGRIKTITYSKRHHKISYIKSADSFEQIKSNMQKKVAQDLKKMD